MGLQEIHVARSVSMSRSSNGAIQSESAEPTRPTVAPFLFLKLQTWFVTLACYVCEGRDYLPHDNILLGLLARWDGVRLLAMNRDLLARVERVE